MLNTESTEVSPSLKILYEDEALLFVDKVAGMVVQRGYDATEPVLYEIAAQYVSPLFLMQRLDRGTSGVMFFSKQSEVNARLTRQFEKKRIRKRYVALCEGELRERQTVDAPLRRIGPISFGVGEPGKRAVTHLETAVATTRGSVVLITLETGRTHQIRVHCAAIGHPLTGDWLYGERNAARPMLHSETLSMTHPLTGLQLSVEAAIPSDFLEEAASRGLDIERGQSDTWRCQLSD